MQSLEIWAYRGIIFLVVSCPCALVASIPLSFFAALGRASKDGILIKGSAHLEALNALGAVVFDKTGTLTTGSLSVSDIENFSEFSKDYLVALAKALEAHSTHPVACAIMALPSDKTMTIIEPKESAGGGICAQFNGELLALGNARFIREISGICATDCGAKCEIFLALGRRLLGKFTLADTIRFDAEKIVRELRARGLELFMLSGDAVAVAQKVALELGISPANCHAGLLPGDKVARLWEIMARLKDANTRKKRPLVAFVGDGINDAPSLAQADISVAMGSGSDIATNSADIVVLGGLQGLSAAFRIAAKTRRILWQNIIFALGVKAAIMGLGVLGWANLWWAMFGDVGVAVLALLNALRALR